MGSRAERPKSSRKAKDSVTLSDFNEPGIVGISVVNAFQRYLARCQEIRESSWKTGQPWFSAELKGLNLAGRLRIV